MCTIMVRIRSCLAGFILSHQLLPLYTPLGDLLGLTTRHMLMIPKSELHSPNFSLGFRQTRLVITAHSVHPRPHLFKLASSLALPFLESHVHTHHILPDLCPHVSGLPPPFSLYLRSLYLGAQQLVLDTTVTSSYTRSSRAQSQISMEDQIMSTHVTWVTKFHTKFP